MIEFLQELPILALLFLVDLTADRPIIDILGALLIVFLIIPATIRAISGWLAPTIWDVTEFYPTRQPRQGWILGEHLFMPGWARPLERALTRVTGEGRWKVRLTARRGQIVRGKAGTHHIVIAGSGRGKSQTLMSAVLDTTGGVIVTDPKGEIYEATSRYRARRGRLWVIGPDWAAQPWPVSTMFGDTDKGVTALIAAAQTNPELGSFLQPYGMALRALLADANRRRRSSPWADALGTAEIAEALRVIADDERHPGRFAANQALNAAKSERYWGSVLGVATAFIGPLQQLAPNLDAETQMPNLARDTVYIQIPATVHPDSPAAVIVRWLLDGLWHWALKEPPAQQGEHCWFAIDEAGILKPALLPNVVAFGRSAGIGAIAYVQALAQLEAGYGRDTAAGLIASTNGSLTIWPSATSQTEIRLVAERLKLSRTADQSPQARQTAVLAFAEAGGYGFHLPATGYVQLIGTYAAHRHMRQRIGSAGPVRQGQERLQPERQQSRDAKGEEFL